MGTFDLENYGDLLFPLIARMELERRVGPLSLRLASPCGSGSPVRMPGGEPTEELGAWDPERVAHLAEDLDAIVVGGGDIIHFHDGGRASHYDEDASPSRMRRRAATSSAASEPSSRRVAR